MKKTYKLLGVIGASVFVLAACSTNQSQTWNDKSSVDSSKVAETESAQKSNVEIVKELSAQVDKRPTFREMVTSQKGKQNEDSITHLEYSTRVRAIYTPDKPDGTEDTGYVFGKTFEIDADDPSEIFYSSEERDTKYFTEVAQSDDVFKALTSYSNGSETFVLEGGDKYYSVDSASYLSKFEQKASIEEIIPFVDENTSISVDEYNNYEIFIDLDDPTDAQIQAIKDHPIVQETLSKTNAKDIGEFQGRIEVSVDKETNVAKYYLKLYFMDFSTKDYYEFEIDNSLSLLYFLDETDHKDLSYGFERYKEQAGAQ